MLESLLDKLRTISLLCKEYKPDNAPGALNGFNLNLQGFGHSTLSLAVHKKTVPIEFAHEQATFMLFLGEKVCPKILSVDDYGYVMEYLRPVPMFVNDICTQERFLYLNVWNRSLEGVPFAKQIGDEFWRTELEVTIGTEIPDWAIDELPCLIHGDPTLDNTLLGKDNEIRITDPIPPHRLVRPSIRAIDQSKMLQSLLGWEVVFRGVPRVSFIWPNFMLEPHVARRAVFWCMVALKRIALRNNSCNAGKWAEHIARELEQCM